MINSGIPSNDLLKKNGVQPERVKVLNNRNIKSGSYIIYWMQASQRSDFNHALEYAILLANEQNLPLLVYFVITPSFPGANLRHYTFMLEGLQQTEKQLAKREITFKVVSGKMIDSIYSVCKKAAALITDRGYTAHQVEWRSELADNLSIPVIQVESDVVIPVETVSNKEEYAARTIRPKINKLRHEFLIPLKKNKLENKKSPQNIKGLELKNIDKILSNLEINENVKKTNYFHGGEISAENMLSDFIKNRLYIYDKSNDPNAEAVSKLSPYLHFGQISPVKIALAIVKSKSKRSEDFLEQLIIRRELAINFCYYSGTESSYKCLPDWPKKTLENHSKDKREYNYSFKDFENAKTHDPAWNAAQKEMVLSGHMHGYMRMYWGKKIIEWSADWKEAYKLMLMLNNKYELDGRGPNAYAGVAWCFGKHDTAWKERQIFGKVRYMNFKGLKRKFDIEKYIQKINAL